MKILVAEDDAEIGDYIRKGLIAEGIPSITDRRARGANTGDAGNPTTFSCSTGCCRGSTACRC